ncbi:hypothetical protein [Streptomyces sp. NPDC053048]|uniref:hypothetical protein n=1 Tax=Streptomyces sp. NPDC053048 TaxID=3365694 RepID=UPI0037D36E30
MSRALALPEKGEPQRRTAITAWGLLASVAVYTGGMGLTQHHPQSAGGKGPAKAAPDLEPDAQPLKDPKVGDVYRRDPKKGYVPTYFDGRGGIAGVPLTDEQRRAVVKEALRRGVSPEDAHALAYGEAEESGPIVKPNIKPPSFGGSTLLASGPVYREVAPAEKSEAEGGAPASGSAAPGDDLPAAPQSKGGEGKGKEKAAKEKKQPTMKESLKRSVEAVIPDPIEEPVEDFLGRMSPFRSYMFAISAPGTEPTFTVAEPEGGMVTVTAESQVTDNMTVTVDVTAPVEETPEAPPSTVSVTVTDPQTDTVTVATETETVEGGHDDIPRVAIGEVVEAVVTAATDDSAQPGDVVAAGEAIEDAQEALESLPEPEQPQPSPEPAVTAPASAPEESQRPVPTPEMVEPRPSETPEADVSGQS